MEDKSQGFHILLVDDEAADAEILLRSLEQELDDDENREFDFTVVARAEGALKVLEEKEVHLILADVRMPGIGGIEFLQRIQGRNQIIPVTLTIGPTSTAPSVKTIR